MAVRSFVQMSGCSARRARHQPSIDAVVLGRRRRQHAKEGLTRVDLLTLFQREESPESDLSIRLDLAFGWPDYSTSYPSSARWVSTSLPA